MTGLYRWRDDRGAATVFVIGMSIVLLALAGLVVDGGLAINARQRVADDVEQAARAGAQEIDVATLRASGTITLNQSAAQLAAEQFLVQRGYASSEISVSITGTTVTAGAAQQIPTTLLQLIFIRSFHVSAQAQARAAVGITGEIP